MRSSLLKRILKRALPVRSRDDLVKIGSPYGGWTVPIDLMRPGWICYCVGTGTDITFDLSLAGGFECKVYAFDPTPASIRHVDEVANDAPNFTFLPYGVWTADTEARFYAPADISHVSHSIKNLQRTEDYFIAVCRSLPSLMEELGHERIDLLKLDIEGAEHDVLEQILDLERPRPSVLCVEFDQPMPLLRTIRVLRRLLATYDLVAIDNWNYTFVAEQEATPT